ncbi:Os04g0338950, partial [Oryza sativa Japonica Group]
MICSMMRTILSRLAIAARGAADTIAASLDDGNRSATLSPDVRRTTACSAARYSPLCSHRLPTEHRSTVSLTILVTISLRLTAAPAVAAADRSRMSRATSSSRTRRNERTRDAVRSSWVSSLRSWRHRSPYGDSTTSRPPKLNAAAAAVRWRSANARSWLRRTSRAASGDDATTVPTSPNQSCISGAPCLRASLRIALWTLSLEDTTWWMLPISGSVHGPGGRLSLGFAANDIISLETTTTNRMDAPMASTTLSS